MAALTARCMPQQHPRAPAATAQPIRRWSLWRSGADGRNRWSTNLSAASQQPDASFKGSRAASAEGQAEQQQSAGPVQSNVSPQDSEMKQEQWQAPPSQEELLWLAVVEQQQTLASTMSQIKQEARALWPVRSHSADHAVRSEPQRDGGPAAVQDALAEILGPEAAAALAKEMQPAAAAAAAQGDSSGTAAAAASAAPAAYSPGDRLAAAFQRSARRISAKLSGSSSRRAGPGDLQEQQQQPWAVPLVVTATWIVFLMEWAPVLPSIWEQACAGNALHLLAPLLMSPGSETTMALVADGATVLAGRWQLLLSAGLLHGGLLPLLWCTDGMLDAGAPLEESLGSSVVLVLLGICAAFAAACQVLVAEQRYVLAGAGVMVGMYSALTAVAMFGHRVLLVSPKGLLYLVLTAFWGWYHPHVGLWSLVGGALGGLLGLLVAPWLEAGLRVAVGLPLMLGLATARLLWTLVVIIAAFAVQMVQVTVQAVAEAVRTVRNL